MIPGAASTRYGEAGLRLEKVDVDLRGRSVLRGISAEISGGGLVAIVGPNGAGKSTLLRAAAGIIPHRGEILHGGARPALAYLPQNGNVAWPMPVRDIVALGRPSYGGLRSLLSAADREIVESVMEACGLQALADRPATDLSGGELSRVLLARALAVRAPLLLLDEPVAALDPAHQIATMELLRAEAARGVAVVAVMHDLTLVLRYATRILVLANSRLIADGAPAFVLESGLLETAFGIRIETVRTAGGATLASYGPG